MRALLAVSGCLLLWPPGLANAQADAGVTPAPDAAAPSLAPAEVAAQSSRADAPGPIDATAEAIRGTEQWLVDGQRRDAIRHGVVSGYYAELGRSMRAEFHPDLVAIEAERRRGMSLPELALDELERYGPPEAPRGPASAYTPEMRTTTAEDAQVQQQFEIQSMLNAHTRWTRVEVHVLQDRTGHVLSATITHGSDSHTLDAAALAAVSTAAVAQPPPPGVLGERQTIESDWSFWAGEVVPYVGQAGCMEDQAGQGLQCTALGRPLLRTRVVLLDVHDAEHDPSGREGPRRHRTSERASELHAPVRDARDAPVHDVVPDMPTHAYAPPGAPSP